jgi:hypothetical protein
MKYFYDFEFLEDGVTIEPISLGIAAEDDRTLYWVNTSFNWDRLVTTQAQAEQLKWLNEHVRPHLDERYDHQKAFRMQTSPTTAASLVREFLTDWGHGSNTPELWGYYSDYDHVALAQMFGRMTDWPFPKTMLTYDLKQLMDHAKVKSPVPKPSVAHNALHDALWIRDTFRAITPVTITVRKR